MLSAVQCCHNYECYELLYVHMYSYIIFLCIQQYQSSLEILLVIVYTLCLDNRTMEVHHHYHGCRFLSTCAYCKMSMKVCT